MSAVSLVGSFDEVVLKSELPVLVDFWAPWCVPCKALLPLIDEVAKAHAGRLKVVKVNVDEHAELAGEFGIRTVPTIMLFKHGVLADHHIGRPNRQMLEEKIAQL